MNATKARKQKPAKIDYARASAMMGDERARVVRDAQSAMRNSQCFTDAMIYGLPFGNGDAYPATRSLGWCRPNDDIPAGCDVVARIPISNLTELQAVRMLSDRMENFPAFNCDKIA